MLRLATPLAVPDSRTSAPSKAHYAPRRHHRQRVQFLWAVVDCSSLETKLCLQQTKPPHTCAKNEAPGRVMLRGTGVTGMFQKSYFAALLLSYASRVGRMVARREKSFQRLRPNRHRSYPRWP